MTENENNRVADTEPADGQAGHHQEQRVSRPGTLGKSFVEVGVPTGGGHGKARLCSPEHLAEYAAAILGQGQAGQGYGERRLKEAPDGQARRICTTERLRPMRFHSLRYTAATLLMAKGAPVTTATFPLRSGRSQPVSPCA